jgi:hypothetical protein
MRLAAIRTNWLGAGFRRGIVFNVGVFGLRGAISLRLEALDDLLGLDN